jgi:hypothetical protein
MATTIVSRTQSGAESAAGRRTWTFSCWFKRSKLGSFELFGSDSDGARNNNFFIIDFRDTDEIDMAEYISGYQLRFITNRKFRDTSAWYHLVVAFDTTQSTASDRVKIYVNGVQETSFSTATYPSQDYQTKMFAQNKIHAFGRSSGYQIDGILSHCHATEGTAYTPSAFGSTDSTTGEWKINTSPSVSYGTNGFFLFKNDNSVTNQAGNSSGNFAVTAGTLTKTEDNPSNVFNLFNKLVSQTGGVAGRNSTIDAQMFNGNTTIATSIAYWTPQLGNMEMFSGKYYWEQKFEVDGTPSNYLSYIGIEATDTAGTNLGSPSGRNTDAIAYGSGGDVNKSNGNVATYDTWTAGDIVMCAVDLDNNYIYFGKNGTWQNSGDPTSGATGTGGIAVTTGKSYITAGTIHRGGNYSINTTYSYAKCNFGNGYFGTTAVSSAGTNASGNGIFEYDVPTGYTALSTKGLNL